MVENRFPNFKFEDDAAACGRIPVCGIDEAGRGPWAGPVVAAAVILDRRNFPTGINDSKKLNAVRREELFKEIAACAEFGIGIAEVEMIDRINILQASLWAMAEAVRRLKQKPVMALVDGNRSPQLSCDTLTIVSGDELCLSIAAASIIAKVTRDRLMKELDREFPQYGFASHKGYGTETHQVALCTFGPSPQHRKSFAPVAALLGR